MIASIRSMSIPVISCSKELLASILTKAVSVPAQHPPVPPPPDRGCRRLRPALTYGEDWLLWLHISLFTPMNYIKAERYVLRRHGASLMCSPHRLSVRAVESLLAVRRNPALRVVRRELRWPIYGGCKDVAMNNVLSGRRLRDLGFALLVLSVDPREVGDLLTFLRLLSRTGPALAGGFQRYTLAEWLNLSGNQALE